MEVSPEDSTIVPKHVVQMTNWKNYHSRWVTNTYVTCCNTSVASVSEAHVTGALALCVNFIKDLPTYLPSFISSFLPSFLPSWVRHAVNISVSRIELCMLPAIATDVHVSVVHTAVGSPCTYRKRVLYIAFTHVLPSVSLLLVLLFTNFPKVCCRRYSACYESVSVGGCRHYIER
jgi:hypothetical protein